MWKNYISDISNDYQFKTPATSAEIASLKKELNVELPKKLKELYSETNGVSGEYGIYLIWSTEQMVKENLFFRTIHNFRDNMIPLDNFLFFSDAGNGDLFGYQIIDGRIQNDEIYVWNHEDDTCTVIASSLEDFISRMINGGISV
ncbi:SMI1/KNR4 family protein [Bacillus sp. JJ664]